MTRFSTQPCHILFSELEQHLGPDAKEPTLALLETIMAPESLQALFVTLERLPAILSIAAQICTLQEDTETLSERIVPALTICQRLLERQDTLRKHPGLEHLFWRPEKDREGQYDSILEKHPLFACLGHRASKPDTAATYDQLLAQVFLATHIIDERESEDLQRLEKAYRAIRFLSRASNAKQLVALPAEPVTLEQFTQMIGRKGTGSRLEAAGVLFAKALEGFRSRRRSVVKVGKPVRAPGPTSAADLEDYQEPSELWAGEEPPPRPVLSRDEAQQYHADGGALGEFESPRDIVPVPANLHRDLNRPVQGELAFQARLVSARRGLTNQLSWLGWNELSPFDIQVLLDYLAGDTPPAQPQPLENLVRACLALMFWGSLSLERAAQLPIYPTETPGKTSGEGLYWQQVRAPLLRLHSPGPLLAARPEKQSPKALKVTVHSHVPLPTLACDTLATAFPELATTTRPFFLWSQAGQDHENALKELTTQARQACLDLNKPFGTRLSLGRISHCLEHALSRRQGADLPSAMLFFGCQPKTPITRLHYTQAPARRLETSYRQLCRHLANRAGRQLGFATAGFVNEDIGLGTPFAPRREAVQKLVDGLLDALRSARPSSGTLTNIVHFHNQFAIYTACCIAFSTGYRAIHDPSFAEEDIDFQTGLAVISDKDTDDYYNTRLVWITPPCLNQIGHYRRHLLALYDHLSLTCPPLFNLIKDHSAPGSPLTLFYVHHDLEQIEMLRPGVLKKQLFRMHGYDLPVNANRHYLKGELMASGCSPEIIEAFIGHWGLGQEPWSRLSGLHPLDYRDELQKYLEPIIHRDGWVAVEGFAP